MSKFALREKIVGVRKAIIKLIDAGSLLSKDKGICLKKLLLWQDKGLAFKAFDYLTAHADGSNKYDCRLCPINFVLEFIRDELCQNEDAALKWIETVFKLYNTGDFLEERSYGNKLLQSAIDWKKERFLDLILSRLKAFSNEKKENEKKVMDFFKEENDEGKNTSILSIIHLRESKASIIERLIQLGAHPFVQNNKVLIMTYFFASQPAKFEIFMRIFNRLEEISKEDQNMKEEIKNLLNRKTANNGVLLSTIITSKHSEENRRKMVEVLLRLGADRHLKDKLGKDSFKYAEESGSEKIKNILQCLNN